MTRLRKPLPLLVLVALVVAVVARQVRPDPAKLHQRQLDDALPPAVLSNDLGGVNRLLDEGASPNARQQPFGLADEVQMDWYYLRHHRQRPAWDYQPALQIAAEGDEPDMVRTLLVHGADVNQKDAQGYTALGTAYWELRGFNPEAAKAAGVYTATLALLKKAGAKRVAGDAPPLSLRGGRG